jgi:hypothetical protein
MACGNGGVQGRKEAARARGSGCLLFKGVRTGHLAVARTPRAAAVVRRACPPWTRLAGD